MLTKNTFKVLYDSQATRASNGTSFTSQTIKCTGEDLIRVFGEPTYDTPSADEKVRMEWVVEYCSYDEYDRLNRRVFTIYDWKTSKDFNLLEEEYEWHVGSKDNSYYITSIFVEDVLESVFN